MGKICDWVESRLPVKAFFKHHFVDYLVPVNLNFWYFFGAFSIVVLVNQIITGIWLAMVYTPTATEAFNSVEYIMRHVPFGWLLRYLHSTGASAFFIVVYLHMYRGIMYGSYQAPRELLWLTGVVLFLLLMAEAFTGYVLPWGQMSYWGAKVITSIFGAIPGVGEGLVHWIQGDYLLSTVTLHRFFAFHVIAFPLLILALVGLHVVALHCVGSNNPEGVKQKKSVGFHPYYTVKDFMAVSGFLFVFAWVVFYKPDFFGLFLEHDNYQPANLMITPELIKPVWYFSPFYAMLRAVPDKLLGAVVMLFGVLVLALLPWLDCSKHRSIRHKGKWSKIAIVLLVISFSTLGFLGAQPAQGIYVLLARVMTIIYFLCFILMPIYTRFEKPKDLSGGGDD